MKERDRQVRYRVREIYNWECANIDDPRFDHSTPLGLHHIMMRSEGAEKGKVFFSDPKSNRILFCRDCEQAIHSMMK